MKITIISEDHPDGLDVDWPAVPGKGDIVAFRHRGGTDALSVERVEWEFEGHSALSSVKVYLTN
ncbi:hypothetical protein NKI30_19515 [Mesorhizobium opportunistum]|uniref:hypothetical protein n=1 Tax=Mesorhizobium opportunistum TaxID=593909 RepID=UPI003338C9B0